MNYRNAFIAVCALSLFTLLIRLWLALLAPGFADDMTYFTLRQLEHMLVVGEPFVFDSLSFGGREVLVQPVWYILLPFAQAFSPQVAILLVSNLVATLTIPCVFLLSYTMTRSPAASTLSSVAAMLSPIFVQETVNSANPLSLVIFFIVLTMYFLQKATTNTDNKKQYFFAAVLCYFLGIILHIGASIFLLGLLLFFFTVKAEKIKISQFYMQFWLPSFALSLWIFMLFYKDALYMHATQVIYQNMPFALRAEQILSSNIFSLIGAIGLLPILLAVFAYMTSLSGRRTKGIIFTTSVGLAAIGLAVLTVISVQIAATLVSITAAILVAPAYLYILNYLKDVRVKIKPSMTYFILMMLLIVTLGVPYVYTTLNQTTYVQPLDQELIEHIQETETNAIIVWEPDHAQELMYKTQRATAIDYNFLLVRNSQAIYDNYQTVYNSVLIQPVIRALNTFGVSKDTPGYIITSVPLPAQSQECLKAYVRTDTAQVLRSDCEVSIRE